VYRADRGLDETFELFSVPIDGSQAPVRISPSLVAGQDVTDFKLATDGAKALFRVTQPGAQYLGVTPTDGSAPAQLLHTASGSQRIGSYAIDRLGTHALFTSGVSVVPALFELYRARLDGLSMPVLIDSEPFPAVAMDEFHLSPDGSWASYRIRYEVSSIAWFDVFILPTDGSSSPRRVDSPNQDGSSSGAQFAPGGNRVLFTEYDPSGPVSELFSAPLVGPTAFLFLIDDDDDWCISSDGNKAFGSQGLGVFWRPVDGSAPLTHFATMPPGEFPRSLAVTPSGEQLLVVTEVGGIWRLRSVPTAGGPTKLLATSEVSQLGLRGPMIAPNSRRLAYELNTGPGVYELFFDRPEGTFGLQLNAPLPAGGTVKSSKLVGSSWALYLASQDTAGVFELYRAPLEYSTFESHAAPSGPPLVW
jgi:hypothetical protein